MSVRIRMKKMGRKHRPYFRICAMNIRAPRDGKVLEELGTYDPLVPDTDARVTLNKERVDYWLSVGAQPSVNVRAFIKKYGTNGTHAKQHDAAREKLKQDRSRGPAPMVAKPRKKKEEAAPAQAEAAAAE
jgi:small subunit ribosomal protein S16